MGTIPYDTTRTKESKKQARTKLEVCKAQVIKEQEQGRDGKGKGKERSKADRQTYRPHNRIRPQYFENRRIPHPVVPDLRI